MNFRYTAITLLSIALLSLISPSFAFGADRPILDGQAIPYKTWHITRLPNEALGLTLPDGYNAKLDGALVSAGTLVSNKAGSQTLVINKARLETLRENLVADGITDAKTFFVMSGFRTPFYNTAIGSAKYSRHMYGDASDIYIDVSPRDGNMDDLNKDGKITKADANFLYDYAAKLFSKSDKVKPGGLGSYKANAVHGPFVHVDGRGRAARWGR